jgi:hypothetical protein
MLCGITNGFCERTYRVQGRLDRMISESSGEMRKVEGTVFLEDSPLHVRLHDRWMPAPGFLLLA